MLSTVRYQLRCEDISILTVNVPNETFFKKEFAETSQYRLVKQIFVETPVPHWEDAAPGKKLVWDW